LESCDFIIPDPSAVGCSHFQRVIAAFKVGELFKVPIAKIIPLLIPSFENIGILHIGSGGKVRRCELYSKIVLCVLEFNILFQ
jgi:hypothetical protein